MLRTQVKDVLANMATLGQTTITVDSRGTMVPIDPTLEPEYATDKDAVKIVGCRNEGCARPVIVTTFMAPAKVECKVCQGEAGPGQTVATVGVPIPGETEPSKAVDLTQTLLNPQFGQAVCPVCIEPMELKSVNHSDHYGPGHFDGKGGWHQDAKGETVMHQCNKCLVVLTLSTTARHEFRRINEVRAKPGRGANAWLDIVGDRKEDPLSHTPWAAEKRGAA